MRLRNAKEQIVKEENALCTVRHRCSPWCVGLSPTKNLPVQALETLSGTHLCNYFKRVASFASNISTTAFKKNNDAVVIAIERIKLTAVCQYRQPNGFFDVLFKRWIVFPTI
ncbi:hypothetical protein J6590_037004 [Homalodisca vitripennis]|nr:hypothetical protein J6590_037004 [Homalodisca vitripennis]